MMKKISKVSILLALFSLALVAPGCSNQEAVLAKYGGPITAKLNEDIANMACVPAWPFPFSSRETPKASCTNCDKFAEAGLLTKDVVEDPFAASSFGADTPQRYKPAPDIRFELTELGKATYIAGSSDGPWGNDPPRFCFGKVHVNRITRTVGPVMNGNVKMIGVRYIAEIENPNPFILDPRAKLLGIKLPFGGPMAAGKPVLYPEANVTAIFNPNNPNNPNDFYLDGSLQIGR
jgi:hypothetical protein